MAEGDAGEPVNANVDVRPGLASTRYFEVAAARRAAADENRVVAFAHEAFQTVDATLRNELTAGRQRVTDLFVDHIVGQPKLGNLPANHAAGARIGAEHQRLGPA